MVCANIESSIHVIEITGIILRGFIVFYYSNRITDTKRHTNSCSIMSIQSTSI